MERNDSLVFVGLGNKQSGFEPEQQGSSRCLPHGEGQEGPGWWHWQVAVISRTGSLVGEMVLRWFDTKITKGECREPIPKRRKHPEDSWRRSRIPSVQGSAKPVKFGYVALFWSHRLLEPEMVAFSSREGKETQWDEKETERQKPERNWAPRERITAGSREERYTKSEDKSRITWRKSIVSL